MRWSTTPCRKFSPKPEIIRAAAPPDSPKYKEDLTNGPTQSCTPPVARPEKQNTFFGGAAILAVGIMVVKLIGMFYKIPLINIIGEQGSADFGNAYNIYAVLLTISTAGLPVARVQAGQRGERHRTAKPGAPGVPAVPGPVSYPGCAVLPHHVLWLGTAGRPDERRPGRPRHPRPGSGGHLRGLSVRLPGLCPGSREHDAHRRLPDHRGPV